MASIMAVLQIAWIYYGLLIVSRAVTVWNVVGVVTNSPSGPTGALRDAHGERPAATGGARHL
jgi:hypothetical protein